MIALSKGSPDTSYAIYYNWIKSLDSSAKCVDMYALDENEALKQFRECSGLILTGGTDIDPAFYDKAYDTVRCWPIDAKRDKLEMRLLDSALAWGMPVLGICRGHQLINVALGGSLVVDIPQDRGTTEIHQCEDYLGCVHSVRLAQNSLLAVITQSKGGEVTTNHHQAVDALAQGMKVSAYTSDGIIEAIEWADTTGKPFLIGVQWHPERMDLNNPLSGAIGREFLEECRGERSVGSRQ
jgi:putative glutamine amidotransferase